VTPHCLSESLSKNWNAPLQREGAAADIEACESLIAWLPSAVAEDERRRATMH
jgi:hypothetical protein